MGRAVLIIALMVGTIYGGIMLRMQNRMYKLPQMQVKQYIEKEVESVSDFALRTAIRNSVILGLQANAGTVTSLTQRFNNYAIGNCVLDSIRYTFTGVGSQYRAQTFVRGNLMGRSSDHPAEIAFSFPVSSLFGKPDRWYLEMDQPQFNPAPTWNHVIDSSPWGNHGWFWGDVTTRPMGYGANGWKCASFGPAGGWIDFVGNASTEVSTNFSLISFVKIREGSSVSTVVWLPSDPYDTDVASGGHPGLNLRYKPTAGIWYSSGNLHFSSVTTAGLQSTVSIPFTPLGRWPHNRDQWVFMGLTFANGTLRAYINGLPVGVSNSGGAFAAMPSRYGFTIGRKDIRNLGSGGVGEYMYMFGLIDQVGLYGRTLTDGEMQGIYEDIISPANMQYVKD